LTGKATNSLSVLRTGAFRLENRSGSILVLTRRFVPWEGQQLSVRGTVTQMYHIIDNEMIVIVEHESAQK
jgi:hypothetical protein